MYFDIFCRIIQGDRTLELSNTAYLVGDKRNTFVFLLPRFLGVITYTIFFTTMRIFIWIVAMFMLTTACTIDKIDFESENNTVVPDDYEFKEVVSIDKGSYHIRVEALHGKLYKGYNEIRLRITEATTQAPIQEGKVTFLPVLTTSEGNKETCPNQYALMYDKAEEVYKGFSVFTQENTQGDWKITITMEDDNGTLTVSQPIAVEKQVNKNLDMTSFIGSDTESYLIALVAPLKPKVAENELVAAIYKLDSSNTALGENDPTFKDKYVLVEDYTLLLDPRMPEPSMGNHSSPHNKDLVQKEDGFYYGIVNYTMTGNWTLNFILLNKAGLILKGTKVPTDFTPGVEGKKSELFIDTLF